MAFGSFLSSLVLAQSPALSLNDVTAVEGNVGKSDAVFTANLSAVSTFTITVDYRTFDGTATVASDDYESTAGTLIIFAGQTSGTISVPIGGDSLTEGNETFTVVLSDPSNATIARGTAIGTILNDDGPTPPPTSTFTPTRTPPFTASATTTTTPTTTPTNTATPTTTVTPTATGSATPSPTGSPSPSPTSTQTFSPTTTSTQTRTPTRTPTLVLRAPVIPAQRGSRVPRVIPVRTPA